MEVLKNSERERVLQEQAGLGIHSTNYSGMSHGGMNHGEMNHGGMSHGGMNHGEMNHGGMSHGGMSHGGMNHGGMNRGGMDHGGMDMSHHLALFRKKLTAAVILTVPLIILSSMIQQMFGYYLKFPGSGAVELVLGSVLYFYCASPFLKGAAAEVKKKKPGMMSLVTSAVTVAYFYSAAVVFGVPGHDFFWELGTLIVIMLWGHWIEMKSVMGASGALEMLASLLPETASVRQKDGSWKPVSLERVQAGDVLLVKANEKIPADGVVLKGTSYLNESMLTGESRPAQKQAGDTVIGGAVNGSGMLEIRVSQVGSESYLSQVISTVRQAQSEKSAAQNLADRAAGWLTYTALGAGILTWAVWYSLTGDISFAVSLMVGVMVVACPHALGLAVPLVVSNSTACAARMGVLIRNRTAFENSGRITTVIFDKTGTLTKGTFQVTGVRPQAEGERDRMLVMAAALEQYSEHPIARAIAEAGRAIASRLPEVKDFQSLTARGVEGKIDGHLVQVLSPGAAAAADPSMKMERDDLATIVYVMEDGKAMGAVLLSDEIRPEAAEAVRRLQEQGIQTVMATGDNQASADAAAARLGIDRVYAQLLPMDKIHLVETMQTEQQFVAMVGDGVNDAPALAKADVGIAIGGGTAIAGQAADIILVRDTPDMISKVISWGALTKKKMIQNLVWAAGYNAVTIPIAAGVFYPFILPPEAGAAVMSLSTVIVAVNAQMLLKEMK